MRGFRLRRWEGGGLEMAGRVRGWWEDEWEEDGRMGTRLGTGGM